MLNEYYNILLGDDNQTAQDPSQILKRNHMDSLGVKDELTGRWNGFIESKNIYDEVLDCSKITYRRSHITSERSMNLYTSFFEGNTNLSSLKRIYLLGEMEESKENEKEKNKQRKPENKSKLHPRKDQANFCYRDREGFEQINEDLYARKDNKFIVFNGAAVDVWDESVPVTKMEGMVDLFST